MTTTHQVAITVVAPVMDGELPGLKATLAEMACDPGNSIIPFARLDGVHFARLVLIPPQGEGEPTGLALLLDCDAPDRSRLRQLVKLGGQGLDAVFGCCEGYPDGAARSGRLRYAYLRDHRIPEGASYVNWIGRTLTQIRQEAMLREALEHFLDERGPTPSTTSATEVRAEIQAHVRETPELKWALEPAPKPSLRWRAGEWLHIAGAGALIMVAAPVAIAVGPFAAVALRRREKSDPAPRLVPDDAHVQQLAAVEDILAQNQFFAVGELKPGRFRLMTARVVLWLVNLALRHYFNRGTLTGVKTIHAARWVFLDDYRRLMFASNYDGSLENYMDDFIDKVSWGLNAVFSNGVGYPRTNWLVLDGAEDEQAFKSYIRTRQKVSEVWYSAYGNLTTLNLENNAAIRAGLSGEMDEALAQAWLRRL